MANYRGNIFLHMIMRQILTFDFFTSPALLLNLAISTSVDILYLSWYSAFARWFIVVQQPIWLLRCHLLSLQGYLIVYEGKFDRRASHASLFHRLCVTVVICFFHYNHRNNILPLEVSDVYREYTLWVAWFKLNQLLSKALRNKLR